MLGFVARFGSSKGMVKMPNLSGLTRPQAITALENAGLVFSGSSTETTSNSSLSDKIKTQSIPVDTLLEYESSVSFVYYSYVPYVPTVTYGNCGVYAGASITSSYVCVNYGQNNIDIETVYLPSRRDVFFDGVFAYEEECQPQTVRYENPQTARCGYVAPAKVCVYSETWDGPWSGCQEIFGVGTRVRYKTYTYTNCSSETKKFEEDCCAAGLVRCTNWTTVPGGQTRTCTYRRVDCSTYTVDEIKCTPRTTTTCTSCTKKAPFRKTCTTTTIASNCNQSSSSASQAC